MQAAGSYADGVEALRQRVAGGRPFSLTFRLTVTTGEVLEISAALADGCSALRAGEIASGISALSELHGPEVTEAAALLLEAAATDVAVESAAAAATASGHKWSATDQALEDTALAQYEAALEVASGGADASDAAAAVQ